MSYRQVPTSSSGESYGHQILRLTTELNEALKHKAEYFAALESCIAIREALKKERDSYGALLRETMHSLATLSTMLAVNPTHGTHFLTRAQASVIAGDLADKISAHINVGIGCNDPPEVPRC